MMKRFTVVGLCGRSGSGKGYVSGFFQKSGIPCLDTDKIYRDIIEDKSEGCLSELVEYFGKNILDSEGKLDRRKLAETVFCDSSKIKLKKLNEITHKYILKKTQLLIARIKESGKMAVVIDAPVLFESGFDKLCMLTVCVTAPDSLCVERICSRDGRTEDEAMKRLSGQMSVSELKKLCHEEIVNDGVANVRDQVASIIKKYGLGDAYEK